ncbi:MAG: PAS domain S-box protein [Verrucomicrobiia bacterium]|jgi:PAS domain S-box-containing protein
MNNPVVILHLEDNPCDAELVRHSLRQTTMTFELRLARNRAEYEAALAETKFDLILSDYDLPDYDGITALKLAGEKQPDVPFILVTGALGEDQAVDAMLLGATDYVLKQRLQRLGPAVLRALTQADEGRKLHAAEELFRASELRYRRLFESAMDGILILDAETGMVVDVNPFLIEMLGYTHEMFLGKKVWELGFLTNVVANQDNFKELQQKGYVRYEDMALEARDGTRHEVEFVSNVYQVNHRKVIQCNIRDITQRKRAEEALRASEKRFQGLFENTRDAIMTIRPPSWRFTSGNPACVKMFRAKSEEEFISYGPWELSPERQPDGRASGEKAKEMIETAVREGTHFFEWTHRRIGGEEFTADVLLTRMEQEGKVFIHATVRDITERKLAEAALRESEKRLHELNALQGLLLSPNPTEQRLKLVTEAVVRIMGADFARIWMIRPGDRCEAGCVHAQVAEGPHACRFRDRCLHLLASSGRYTHTDGRDHSRVPFGCYKIGKIAAGEEPKFLTNDVTTDPRVHNHAWAKELGLKSFAGYRLVDAEGAPLGVLALFSKHAISAEEDLLLEGIAHATSRVLHSARVKAALRESEEMLRLLMDSTAEAIYGLDMDGKFTFCNAACLRLLGYAHPRDLIGKEMHALIHHSRADGTPLPKDDSHIRRSTRQGNGSHASDQVYWRADGTCFPVEYWSHPIWRGGRPIGSVVTFFDITERKREAEEASRMATVVRDSNDAITIQDLEGRITAWNHGAELMFGYSEQEALKMEIWQLVPRNKAAEQKDFIRRLFAGEKVTSFETQRVTKDGRVLDVWLTVTKLMDDAGKVIGIAATERDITERKRTEGTLRQSEEKYRALIETTNTGFLILDTHRLCHAGGDPRPKPRGMDCPLRSGAKYRGSEEMCRAGFRQKPGNRLREPQWTNYTRRNQCNGRGQRRLRQDIVTLSRHHRAQMGGGGNPQAQHRTGAAGDRAHRRASNGQQGTGDIQLLHLT